MVDQPQDGPEPTMKEERDRFIVDLMLDEGSSVEFTIFAKRICADIDRQSARIAALEAENAALQSRYDACAEKLAAARHEAAEADERAKEAVADCSAARNALWDDESGMFKAILGAMETIKNYSWILEGRGPYSWDDDKYKDEAGRCMKKVMKILRDSETKTRSRMAIGPHPGAPLLAELAALRLKLAEAVACCNLWKKTADDNDLLIDDLQDQVAAKSCSIDANRKDALFYKAETEKLTAEVASLRARMRMIAIGGTSA